MYVNRSSWSSQGDSSPRNPNDAGQSAEQQIDAGQESEHTPKRRKSLIYRYEFNSGKRISIVVDRTSNVIQFENCYSRSRYFRFSPEPHFVCPVADVTSFHTYHVKNKGEYLVLKTRTGTAEVRDRGENFSDFVDALSQAFPSKQCSFHEGSFLAGLLFLAAGLSDQFRNVTSCPR